MQRSTVMETRGNQSLRMVFSRPDRWTIDSVEVMGKGHRQVPDAASFEEFADAMAAARQYADRVLLAS